MEPAELESLLEIEDSSAEAWCDVFLRLLNNRERISDIGEIFYHALLKKVEEIGCKDKHTVWKIIHIINIWKGYKLINIPCYFHLPLFEFKIARSLYYLFPIKVNFNHDISIMHEQLLIALENSDIKAIRLFLNYGCLYPIHVSARTKGMTEKLINRFYRMNAPQHAGHFCTLECMKKFDNRLELLDPHKFTNVRGCENLRVYQRGFKRILLAQLCIEVYQDRNINNPEQSFQCLRLCFRAVTDPFVQAEEFGELLRFLFFDIRKDYVDEIVQDFKTWYPESLEPYRPRSLKHLCRCAIRQKLTDEPEVIPVLLDRIGLPRKLKTYIMGDM